MTTTAMTPTKPSNIVPAAEWESKVDLITRTVAKGATKDELEIFLHQCRKTGLDPLAKQIYFQKRLNKKTNESQMTIITGIDGYRLVADRTGQYAGNDDPIFDDDAKPQKATVTVYKIVGGVRCGFTASARWSQYYPGDFLGFMWNKMPHLMLGKCAEALALRKAFPAELSGVYTAEEMQQADSQVKEEVAIAKTEAFVEALKCEDCGKEVDAATVSGKFYSLEYVKENAQKHWQKNLCVDCQLKRIKKGDEGTKAIATRAETALPEVAKAVVEGKPVSDVPDPYFAEIDGKLLCSGTVAVVSSPTKSGKGVKISLKLLDGSYISTWHASMFEPLAKAKDKRCIFEYSVNGLFKNIEVIRKIGETEFDGGVPVIQRREQLEITDEDVPY